MPLLDHKTIFHIVVYIIKWLLLYISHPTQQQIQQVKHQVTELKLIWSLCNRRLAKFNLRCRGEWDVFQLDDIFVATGVWKPREIVESKKQVLDTVNWWRSSVHNVPSPHYRLHLKINSKKEKKHCEQTSFTSIPLSRSQITILSLNWLLTYKSFKTGSFRKKTITNWTPNCLDHCGSVHPRNFIKPCDKTQLMIAGARNDSLFFKS